MLRNISLLLMGFIAVLLWNGCSNKKNTFMSRNFHNLTARYNVYFNGRESLKAGQIKIEDNVKDNYQDILPVFKYSDQADASMVSSDMDQAIKKCVKCIKTHSITVKPKRKKGKKYSKRKEESMKAFLAKREYCNWIDDTYLLMGKANFYKHDFYAAEKSLEIILKKFGKDGLKPEAILWMAKVFIGKEEFDEAKRYLDMFTAEQEIPKKLHVEYNLTYADYYMKQKKFVEAREQIELALPQIKRKRKKARYIFILAQLNLKDGKNKEADELFKEVIKMNPPYDMAFNAQINRAIAFNSGSENSEEIKAQLMKMLKDDKNYDYQDQIYYALAEIYKKEDNMEKALEYYKLSAAKSISNDNQKAMAFLSLADIYFNRNNYTYSQAYYDSTIQYLSNTYTDYDAVSKKAKYLNELIGSLKVIQHQDSIQKVANMKEADRVKYIENIIARLIQEEEATAKRKEQMSRPGQGYIYEDERNISGVGNATRGGGWYFYNPSSINFGKAEFTNKWGRRKLEDNWRRKNKTTSMGEEVEEEILIDSEGNKLTNKDVEFYMLKLPLTDSLMEISHTKIQKAYYTAGEIYHDKLEDQKEAIKTFSELAEKYANGEYTLMAYYKLYQMYLENGNKTEAEKYKRLIIVKFPTSEYAKRLSNPNYVKELLANKQKIENIYLQALTAYKANNFQQTLLLCANAQTTYPNNMLEDKFEFLKTISDGKTSDTLDFKTNLKQFIEKYPLSEVKEYAEDILKTLEEGPDTRTDYAIDPGTYEEQIYFNSPDSAHYYIVVLKNKKTDIENVKFKILSHNLDNLEKEMKEDIVEIPEAKFRIIRVKGIATKTEAIEYMKTVMKQQEQLFEDIRKTDYEHFIVSENNFKTFIENKDINKYLRFFFNNYKLD